MAHRGAKVQWQVPEPACRARRFAMRHAAGKTRGPPVISNHAAAVKSEKMAASSPEAAVRNQPPSPDTINEREIAFRRFVSMLSQFTVVRISKPFLGFASTGKLHDNRSRKAPFTFNHRCFAACRCKEFSAIPLKDRHKTREIGFVSNFIKYIELTYHIRCHRIPPRFGLMR